MSAPGSASGEYQLGRYVAVRAGDDEQHLALSEAVNLLIGAPDVRHDGQLIALVEQHGTVRGDDSGVGVADERAPGILGDEGPDGLLVDDGVTWILSHRGQYRSGAHAPRGEWSARYVRNWVR